jgi:methyl-accepting chemotaxis protein
MSNKWTIGKKLVVSFLGVACITLFLGIVGYYGAAKSNESVTQIGGVILPGVGSLLIMSEAQTAVDGAENALLSRDTDLKSRKDTYDRITAKFKAADDAWKIYEPLPQTVEEAATWKQFVPAWDAWKKSDAAYVALSQEYDKTVEAQTKSNELSAKMTHQGLEVNPVSFAKAEALLNQIVEIYRAKTDTANATFAVADVLTIYTLLTISEAQSAIDGAENGLLDRDIELKARQDLYAKIEQKWKDVDAAWKIYEPLEQTPEEAKIWKEFVPMWNAWKADDQALLALSKEYDPTVEDYHKSNEIYAKMTEQGLVANAATFTAAENLLNKIIEINQIGGEEGVKTATSQSNFLKILSLSAMIIGVALAIGLGLVISRSINTVLRRLADSLGEGAEQTASAAGQVSSSSQSLAQGSSEQAAAIEETSSSVEEMASMTKQNAANADQAKTLAGNARVSADKGTEAMKRMSTAIDDIKNSADKTAKIIKTIDEIAFQTNLLALNAAVEAARAGEAGKGFAVVAEEVRNLAQRSAEAAKNTASLIEESVKNSENGVAISKEVSTNLEEIAGTARKVNDLIAEIAAASNEQSQGIEQINTAVGQMDTVTQQVAANAEESASASEELSAQAEELNKMVGELRALVGGASAGTGQKSAAKATHAATHHFDLDHTKAATRGQAKKDAPKAAKKQAVAQAKSGNGSGSEQNPEEVIPLGDDKALNRF